MIIDDVRRIVEPLHRRVMLMFSRATIERTDDSGSSQRLQVTALTDEVIDNLERCGIYGISSNPVPGAAAVVMFTGGDRSNGVVVSTDDYRYRIHGLKSGEVVIYNNTGTKILLRSDGNIEISGGNVNVTDSDVNVLSGNINVSNGDVIASGISLKNHIHSGVDTGHGNTGSPVEI